eukprot:scaffold8927_cov176-Amphora_coffeaeformis.AAC.4
MPAERNLRACRACDTKLCVPLLSCSPTVFRAAMTQGTFTPIMRNWKPSNRQTKMSGTPRMMLIGEMVDMEA